MKEEPTLNRDLKYWKPQLCCLVNPHYGYPKYQYRLRTGNPLICRDHYKKLYFTYFPVPQ